jgi:hypothetical protein
MGKRVIINFYYQCITTLIFLLFYRLEQHNTETHGQFNEIVQQFKQRLGWIIGIDDNQQSLFNTSTHSRTINTW